MMILQGEFSFNSDKLRSWTKATIVIKRFENGTYAEIGRHSNANSSFFRLKDNFPFTGMGWCLLQGFYILIKNKSYAQVHIYFCLKI